MMALYDQRGCRNRRGLASCTLRFGILDLENSSTFVKEGAWSWEQLSCTLRHSGRPATIEILWIKGMDEQGGSAWARGTFWCSSIWAVCKALLWGSAVAPLFFFFFSYCKKVLQGFWVTAQGRMCHHKTNLGSSAPSCYSVIRNNLWLWQNAFVLLSPFQSCC